jgi:hypothetical protein
MVDTFVDRLSLMLILEVNKRITEIYEKLPELLANLGNVTLREQKTKTGMEICQKYSVEYCNEDKACFYVRLSRDDNGKLQIKASDVVYL